MLGTATLPKTNSQITSIEDDGFWLLVQNEEFFVPFDRYPDFQNATIQQIFNFEDDGDEFYWADLDIDIELDALRHPDRFPLIFQK
ncbi:MAG: hypothetical protein DRI32_04980 [Chloroflexi bacterium]|nr:MAG: hypothetical protein DRI32_04980 [Chloroflexota bacterium]